MPNRLRRRNRLNTVGAQGARKSILIGGLLVLGIGYLAPTPSARQSTGFSTAVLPFLRKNCLGCHSGDEAANGFDMSIYQTESEARKVPAVWERVARKLSTGQMPPPGVPKPPQGDIDAVLAWIKNSSPPKAPPRVTLRRLNKAEYTNTVRDLLGIDFKGAADFPSDDVGYGFDNIGDVLTVSPLLLERYIKAAQTLAGRAIIVPNGPLFSISGHDLKVEGAGQVSSDAAELYSFGRVSTVKQFPVSGLYSFTLRACGDQAGKEACKAVLQIDDKPVDSCDVPAEREAPAEYQLKADIPAGTHKVGIVFPNDYYEPTNPNPKRRDRNLIVNALAAQNPANFDRTQVPRSHRLIFFRPIQKPEDVAMILTAFAKRAYRRPVTPSEVGSLMRLVKLALDNGDSVERGVQLAVTATLVSPNFLYRPEIEDQKGSQGTLSPYQLASRLSYFLWSSMPDQELMDRAEDGSLTRPEILEAEAKRLLQDRRSIALSQNFAAQWLNIRKLALFQADKKSFPEFNEKLRRDMETETLTFFQNLVATDGSLFDLVQGKYSFVNERLANLYGLSGVVGEKFRRVSLEGTPRSGILTQASVLSVTSNPTRTSPVKRGKWLLEEILGTPPPPPPPGVGVLTEDAGAAQPKTLRERLERHRAKPECAVCHSKIDPLGFGMENFDPIGRWRKEVDGVPVDAAGVLPDGRKFSGPEQLTLILMGQKDAFARNMAERLLTYALGRGMESSDHRTIDEIAQKAQNDGLKFSSLVSAIVRSELFRYRGGKS